MCLLIIYRAELKRGKSQSTVSHIHKIDISIWPQLCAIVYSEDPGQLHPSDVSTFAIFYEYASADPCLEEENIPNPVVFININTRWHTTPCVYTPSINEASRHLTELSWVFCGHQVGNNHNQVMQSRRPQGNVVETTHQRYSCLLQLGLLFKLLQKV